ncbi:HCP-like protein [Backusella circina FSU 941]|nr:HCP-like protein [Backusella circina FSU 941]
MDDNIYECNQQIKMCINKAEKHLKDQNYDGAIKYFKKALDHIASKYNTVHTDINPNTLFEEDRGRFFDTTLKLALVYANKNYKENNKENAQLFFQICSKSTMPEIRYRLGKAYLCPESTFKDVKSAISSLSFAADNGHKEAENELNRMENGEKNLIKQTESAINSKQKNSFDSGSITSQEKSSQLSASNHTSIADRLYETSINEDTWMIQNLDSIKTAANNTKDKNSQFTLGYMYEYGIGCEKDIDAAITWYKKAIKNDHWGAHCNLGYIYERHKKYKDAFKLYRCAAMRDCTQAQYNVASCYARGLGTSKNKGDAFHWFERAADNGHHEAQADMGYLYWKKKDFKEAKKYYTRAAKGGVVRAQFALGYIFDQEGENPELVEFVYKECDKLGYLPATNALGYFYVKKKEINKALECYQKAAKQKYTPALNNLALLYKNSKLSQERQEAEVLLEKASMEDGPAKNNLKLLRNENKKRLSANKDSNSSRSSRKTRLT